MNAIVEKALHYKRLLVIVGAAVMLIVFGVVFSGNELKSSIIGTIDTSTYQAVHLDTEKTYFGKVTESEDDFITITDVFYFLDDSKKKLVRRSEESLTINSEHILTAENLEKDNAVVKAIFKYNENK
jgi:hypothetical protein